MTTTAKTWENVCGNLSVFWDFSEIWNSSTLKIPECFQRTILVWGPFSLLWFLIPVEMYCLTRSSRYFIPLSVLSSSKMVANVVLVLLAVVEFSNVLYLHSQGAAVLALDIYNPVIKAMTFLLCIIYVHIERIQGLQSSGVLLLFWLVLSLTELPNYVTWISQSLNQESIINESQFVVYMCYYPFIVGQGILSIFNDVEPILQPPQDRDQEACPKTKSSIISNLFFSWPTRLVKLGIKGQLTSRDVWNLRGDISNPQGAMDLLTNWTSNNLPKMCLPLSLIKTHLWKFVEAAVLLILSDVAVLFFPYLLEAFIRHISFDKILWHGWVHLTLLVLTTFLISLWKWHSWFHLSTVNVSSQWSLSLMVYYQILLPQLKAENTSKLNAESEILKDVKDVAYFGMSLLYFLSSVIQIVLGILLLYWNLGNASLLGISVMIVIKVLCLFFTHKMNLLEIRQAHHKDTRIKMVHEILSHIKTIKSFAWEMVFMKRIEDERLNEVKETCKATYVSNMTEVLSIMAPILAALTSFAIFLREEKKELNSSTIFISIIIIFLVHRAINIITDSMLKLIEGSTALHRICKIIQYEFQEDFNSKHFSQLDSFNPSNVIEISEGFFSWSLRRQPCLHEINIRIQKNSLNVVVGPCGSGKSSFIAAILKEMYHLHGNLNITGSVTFVPQRPWIQAATFRQNIIFGRAFNNDMYRTIVEKCALEELLLKLPENDETIINDQHPHLTPEEKLKINLARALYRDADIFLFDDILASLHNDDKSKIYEDVIGSNGLLKDKTRILVTAELDLLPLVDYIIWIDNGHIMKAGPPDELMQNHGPFMDYVLKCKQNYSGKKLNTDVSVSESSHLLQLKSASYDCQICRCNVCHEENGQVGLSGYLSYFNLCGKWILFASAILAMIGYGCYSGLFIWLTFWTTDTNFTEFSNLPLPYEVQDPRVEVYGYLTLSFGCSLIVTMFILTRGTKTVSISLHNHLIDSIFHAVVAFFETASMAAILKRFCCDMSPIDNMIMKNMRTSLFALMEILIGMIVICIFCPLFLIIAIVVIPMHLLLQYYYTVTIGQIKHFEVYNEQFLYKHFQETNEGGDIIRAFQQQDLFVHTFVSKLNETLKHTYYRKILISALGIRLDLLGLVLLIATALFAMFNRQTIDRNILWMIFTFIFLIQLSYQKFGRSSIKLQNNMLSLNSIMQYTKLQGEAPWHLTTAFESEQCPRGSIDCKNYTDHKDILQNVTFAISEGTKIGIIGSADQQQALIDSLYHFGQANRGSISIANRDISTIGLHPLRSSLLNIGYEPILFNGTIRFNLDPASKHSDEKLWWALGKVNLKDFVSSLPNGLEQEIEDGRLQLSSDMNCLLCFARAILHVKHVVIVNHDQISSSSKEGIQMLDWILQDTFPDCTILILTSDLHAVADLDRVIVLNEASSEQTECQEQNDSIEAQEQQCN